MIRYDMLLYSLFHTRYIIVQRLTLCYIILWKSSKKQDSRQDHKAAAQERPAGKSSMVGARSGGGKRHQDQGQGLFSGGGVARLSTVNPRTENLNFRGFDSSRFLVLSPRSTGDFLEVGSRRLLVCGF